MRVEFHAQTTNDLNSAVAYYNELHAGLGDSLRAEVYAAIENILLNPLQFTVVQHEIRRSFVHRFPYSILFRIIGTEAVRILAIRHHRRHPRFGLSRK